jgi:putative salt-induced outer membrane protein YdiY
VNAKTSGLLALLTLSLCAVPSRADWANNGLADSAASGDTPVVDMSDWTPSGPMKDSDDDWIELTSGELLRGEIKRMYDENLVFDSDKLGDLTLDWDDIKQIHSKRPLSMRLDNRTTVVGQVSLEGDNVIVKGPAGETQTYKRDDVVSLVTAKTSELKRWNFEASFGMDVQSGNTNEVSYSASVDIKRRTALTRFSITYLGNYSRNDGVVSTSNQRVNSYFDYFWDKRLFIRPIFVQYYQDPFQNLEFQGLIGTGVGYQLIKNADFEWDVVAGPAFQYNIYDNVQPGQSKSNGSPAAMITTTYSYDINDDLNLSGNYQIIVTDKETGLLTTNFTTTLSYEINDIFDINTSLIWNRIQDPTPDSSGNVPKRNDLSLIIGLGISY